MTLLHFKEALFNRPIVYSSVNRIEGQQTRKLVLTYPSFSFVSICEYTTGEMAAHSMKDPNYQ